MLLKTHFAKIPFKLDVANAHLYRLSFGNDLQMVLKRNTIVMAFEFQKDKERNWLSKLCQPFSPAISQRDSTVKKRIP